MNTETTEVANGEEKKPELNLTVDVQETSACQRRVKVTVSRADIERYFQQQFDELTPKAEVPGFRTGKAPRNLVENMFRKQVTDQVKGSLLMDSLAQVSDKQDFSAISEPDLDFEQVTIPSEGDMTYEFDIEVRPEFELPNWKGLTLERPEHEFTDEEVEERITKLAANFSTLVPVAEPIQSGDVAICDIVSRFEGEKIAELKEEMIEVKPTLSLSDCEIEGFDKLMEGAQADEKRTAKVVISPYAENEEMQGKEVEIDFYVLDVKRLESRPPSEVAEMIGVESEAELREFIRRSLERRLEYAQREKVRSQISELLTESADWDLPPDLLRRQSRREIQRALMELRSSGFSEAEVTARANRLRQNILEQTAMFLKEHFILERIAEEEGIEDEPADYDLEIAAIAAQRNDSPRRVRARLERTGQMDAVRNMILERKVIELITEHAKFKGIPFETDEGSNSTAISFFAAGELSGDIPEAKYEDAPEQKPLPTAPDRD